MRRTARLLTGTALAVAAAGLGAAPVYGGDTGSLEVFPSSAVPGADVTVNTAACGSDGTANGDADAVGGGTFTLAASAHEQDAIGQFRVPPSAQPGTYEIVATCSHGRMGHRRPDGDPGLHPRGDRAARACEHGCRRRAGPRPRTDRGGSGGAGRRRRGRYLAPASPGERRRDLTDILRCPSAGTAAPPSPWPDAPRGPEREGTGTVSTPPAAGPRPVPAPERNP